jgi:hypothetical protein
MDDGNSGFEEACCRPAVRLLWDPGTRDKFPGERRRGDRTLGLAGAAGLRAIGFPRQIQSPPAHPLVTTILHFRSYYESIRNTGHDTPCPVVSKEQK